MIAGSKISVCLLLWIEKNEKVSGEALLHESVVLFLEGKKDDGLTRRTYTRLYMWVKALEYTGYV
jgi:hypothetical protein